MSLLVRGQVSEGTCIFLRIEAIEGCVITGVDGVGFNASRIDAHPVGIGPRNIKRFNATPATEVMLRNTTAEGIQG